MALLISLLILIAIIILVSILCDTFGVDNRIKILLLIVVIVLWALKMFY